jgi:hypothetical protein
MNNSHFSIQSLIDQHISEVMSPTSIISMAVNKIIEDRGLIVREEQVCVLVSGILSATSRQDSDLQINLDPPCDFGETEGEMRAVIQGIVDDLESVIHDLSDKFSDSIEEVIPKVLDEISEVISNSISEDATEHVRYMREVQSSRAETIENVWGEAIEQLDIMRGMVLEWNNIAMNLHYGPYKEPNTAFALCKLVERGYELVGEIVTLIRAGYADGALARWRSLHEVCVIAMFLAKRSDNCAHMYMSHHLVDELRLLDTDNSFGVILANGVDRGLYVRDLKRRVEAMARKVGEDFLKDYGWASIELGVKKVTFRDLENYVGLDVLRRGYRQANGAVHGGALAALTRVSLGPGGVDNSFVPLEYGCDVAIHYATSSMSMIVVELCLETKNADLITMCMVIQRFASRIRRLIEKAQKVSLTMTPREKLLLKRKMLKTSRYKSKKAYVKK